MRLTIRKPAGWRSKLFTQAVQDEFAALAGIRYDYRHEVAFGPGSAPALPVLELVQWTVQRGADLVSTLGKVVARYGEVVRLPDDDEAAQQILLTARQLSLVYRELISVSLSMLGTPMDERFHRTRRAVAMLTRSAIAVVESIPQHFAEAMSNAESLIARGETDVPNAVSLKLEIDADDEAEMLAAFRELQRVHRIALTL